MQGSDNRNPLMPRFQPRISFTKTFRPQAFILLPAYRVHTAHKIDRRHRQHMLDEISYQEFVPAVYHLAQLLLPDNAQLYWAEKEIKCANKIKLLPIYFQSTQQSCLLQAIMLSARVK